ncbi:MAG: hypothetical protein KDI05_00725 [Halieaceae bacterium]|nr:hypothetical protein [Halieaceae bacterium]MCP5203069.1 hypothetical protein [Pseudomonadales bacterium]
MLDETSYMAGLYAYVGAGLAISMLLALWLRRYWRAGTVALVVLPAAALLLTPAYPREGVTTMAPALIVAVFQVATEGLEGAMHALRPLALTVGVAFALALLLRLSVLRRAS